ncbi:MAG: Fe-S cluster assembly protein SufD [Pseudomonadota bacterium]|nr:Fe-S cluster assembly protein SufD [Pseudomonadota bacterium]
MAVTAPLRQNLRDEDFQDFIAGRDEPQALLEMRRAAWSRFLALGIPTTRDEAWRFTDVSPLADGGFERAGEAPWDGALPPAVAESGHRLVFVNGYFAPGLSAIGPLPGGALAGSLQDALGRRPDLLEAYLGRLPGLENHPFAALNTAFFADGALVYLPRGAVLEAPLHLVFVTTGRVAGYPRNLIVLETGSQAAIVEDFCGDGPYLNAPVTEIRMQDRAVLDYHQIREEAAAGWHLGGLRLRQDRDSAFTLHTVTAGGRLARTDIAARLDGEGADCALDGLTLTEDGQLGDYHVRVDHGQPHGTSRQRFKCILSGKSRTVFDGMIHVHPGAQKTDASQSNRNLLLSRQALANSNPRLEIQADDVKCSHGSTIGFLDPDALFYLRSRGIAGDDARALLVRAFAGEMIDPIRLPPLRQRLEALVAQRLNFADSGRPSS